MTSKKDVTGIGVPCNSRKKLNSQRVDKNTPIPDYKNPGVAMLEAAFETPVKKPVEDVGLTIQETENPGWY